MSDNIRQRFLDIEREVNDAAHRRDVRAAIDHLIVSATAFGRMDRKLDEIGLGGEMGFEDARDDVRAAKASLLRILGLEDAA